MKTFMMIYHQETKRLIYEYKEINDPLTTFNNWFLANDVSYELFKKIVAFYFIGSGRIEERKSGVIKYDAVKGKLELSESPLYFKYSKVGFNYIYDQHQSIAWNDKEEAYLRIPKNFDDFKEDELYDLSLTLEVLIPSMDAFLEVKIRYDFHVLQVGKNIHRAVPMPLKHKSFYKKCKTCKNINEVKIKNMLSGDVACEICKVSNQTKNTQKI